MISLIKRNWEKSKYILTFAFVTIFILLVTVAYKNDQPIVNKNEVIEIKPEKVEKVIDSTGAGDLFAAGTLFGILNNFSLEESAVIGSYCAGQVVSHMGGRLPVHSHTDAKQILLEYKKLYSNGGR